jgi:hypothetical protein
MFIVVFAVSGILYAVTPYINQKNVPSITSSITGLGYTYNIEINGGTTSITNTDGTSVTLGIDTAIPSSASGYNTVTYYYTTTALTAPVTAVPSGGTTITSSSTAGSSAPYYTVTFTPPADEAVYVYAVIS